jgi:hypothetical protein
VDRDLNIKVTCESGYSGCDRPKSVELNGEQDKVNEVVREWREPGAKHYIVRTNSGKQLKLVFYETTGEWNALGVSGSS